MIYTPGKYYSDDVSETLHFKLEKVTTDEANAFRRVILQKIPVKAIGKVSYTTNESSFPDEMLIKRLEYIYVNNNDPNDPRLAPGIIHRFEATCPPGKALHDVESSVITSLAGLINPRILITSLKAGQKIAVSFEIVEGTSLVHNIYSAVSTVGFIQEKKDSEVDTIGADKTYKLFIETTRTHTPKKILLLACDIIIKDLTDAEINDEESKNIRVTKITDNRIVVLIPNSQYTISNMISSHLLTYEKTIQASASKVSDPLVYSSEVHISGINPFEEYHRAIKELKARFVGLKAKIGELGAPQNP
jgi:DNA-directed RNA polymerase alpha subunit